jgi:phosphoenolpyruvate synthase/pyruvate phosphate dikinase
MFYFDDTSVEDFCGSENPKHLLGGKGAGLAQMKSLDVPVPAFIVIPTSVCLEYLKKPKSTMVKIAKALPKVKKHFVKQFGYLPLVSIRSGARVSMPGMMDTILNVGLDASTYGDWAVRLGEDCAKDSYFRLIEMFGNVVNEIPREHLSLAVDGGYPLEFYEEQVGSPFPSADDQWLQAIEAVFLSWNNDRAKTYRQLNGIPENWGTAVVIQAMVFGNLNDNSCTGVLFTRNPSTGCNKITGEFLINAQGEDVVAGIRTPQPLDEMAQWNSHLQSALFACVLNLENEFRDMQDCEFTVQDGKLFILQTRTGKRTAKAAVRIAMDMLDSGHISESEALKRVTLKQWHTAVKPVIDPTFNQPAHGKGIPASNGIASGVAVFSAQKAVESKEPCILISVETTPDDIAGMNAAKGILTMIGGATSHAAVVARGMDRPCVVGCMDLKKDSNGHFFLNGKPLLEGGVVTIDGGTGSIWVDTKVPVISAESDPYIHKFLSLIHSQSDAHPILSLGDGIPEGPCWYQVQSSEEIQQIGSALQGYLDIRPQITKMPAMFREILEVGCSDLDSTEELLGKAVTDLATEIELKFKVVTSNPKVALQLQTAGVGTVPIVTEWEHLLDVQEDAVIDLIDPGHPRVAQIMDLRAKANLPLKTLSVGSHAQTSESQHFLSESQQIRRVLGGN